MRFTADNEAVVVERSDKLERLNASKTQLTDDVLNELGKLDNLHLLSISFTKVANPGVAQLRKARPRLEIVGYE